MHSYGIYGKVVNHQGTSTTQLLYNGKEGVMTD